MKQGDLEAASPSPRAVISFLTHIDPSHSGSQKGSCLSQMPPGVHSAFSSAASELPLSHLAPK